MIKITFIFRGKNNNNLSWVLRQIVVSDSYEDCASLLIKKGSNRLFDDIAISDLFRNTHLNNEKLTKKILKTYFKF